MTGIKEHLKHHRLHMLVCGGGAVILVIGLALSVTAIAIAGAVVCGAGCLSMVWMVVTAARTDRRAAT
jgi:Flp pilus assembly protein TadB